jgi:hypothetical protein
VARSAQGTEGTIEVYAEVDPLTSSGLYLPEIIVAGRHEASRSDWLTQGRAGQENPRDLMVVPRIQVSSSRAI